mmetsp:Transcript_45025/g.128589  ORF Transcript_45025/g.128589 Transcript_45025/m.128589 type:complete len:357 (-) Transcript_45025:145-1215(-)
MAITTLPTSPVYSSIMQRRGRLQMKADHPKPQDKSPSPDGNSSDGTSGTGTPTPSPPPMQRRRPLALDCATIRRRETWGQDETTCESTVLAKEYDVLEVLGQGSTGVVRRARRRSDNQTVSLKIVRTSDPELADIACEELRLLKTFDHAKVIKGYDFMHMSDCVVLVLEHFDGPTMRDAVREAPGRRLPEDKAARLFRLLLDALAYMHEHSVVHRDVKAENILVSRDLEDLRLIDFNTARHLADGALTMTGTREWAAPEVLRGDSPCQAGDIWSAGLCLHLMLSGRMPQHAHRFRDLEAYALALVEALASLSGPRWDGISDGAKNAVRSVCVEDPVARPTAADVLATPGWLRGETH